MSLNKEVIKSSYAMVINWLVVFEKQFGVWYVSFVLNTLAHYFVEELFYFS